VHGSGIAHRALQASCEPVRPEAVGNWTKPDRLDAVLALVGVERRTPLVRKPTGQIIRIQQNGRMTAATIAARRKLAAAARKRTANYEGDASWHESSLCRTQNT
jgi:hypothetical protein